MARLQPYAHAQPAGFDKYRRTGYCGKTGDGIISGRKTPIRWIAALTIFLLPVFAFADSATPTLTTGTYRSTEQHSYLPAEIGLSLSATALPDPALLLKQTEPGSTTAFGPVLWTDDVAWITGIGTLLYNDADRDGYHSGFSLTIDADSSMNFMDVYVTIDLQDYSGSQERLHTSSIFSLYGRTLTDEYQIDIDLLQNYPADDYDLTIELHDSYDHRVLDRVSAIDFSNLSALPLESEELDYAYDPRPVWPTFTPANDDIRVAEYAGGTGLLTTLCLSMLLLARRRRGI